jgi:uncharacterized protein YjbI with pentapeptide repeats
MSQINKRRISCLFLLTGLFLFVACGSSSNSPSAVDPAKEGHAAGWLPAGHASAAQADLSSCTRCHGLDFSGGISRVACTECHLGNALNIHPLAWDDLVGTEHGGYVVSNGNSACANVNCHGAALTGVTGSGPSCTSCHLGGAGSVHPLDWGALTYVKHSLYVAANGTTACANINCHGANLTGVNGSGPSCSSCHIGGPLSVHPAGPVDWADPTQHGVYACTNGTASCSNVVCHGTALEGVSLSGPSCFSCHPAIPACP